MGKPKRTPAAATSRADNKSVRSADIAPPPTPSWRFSTVDRDGPFAWPIGTQVELGILQRLREFDTMRWPEIEGPDHHAIAVSKLSKIARDRLSAIKQDDLDEVFSFHFAGRPRIIGIRDRNAVKLLWWDPEHQVCPSIKKHT